MNVQNPTQKVVLTPIQKINQMITFVQGITTSGEFDKKSPYELVAIPNAAVFVIVTINRHIHIRL
jgi:hypothetical protein